MDGAQCFINANNQCRSIFTVQLKNIGASICADYDSLAACKSISNISCTWFPATITKAA